MSALASAVQCWLKYNSNEEFADLEARIADGKEAIEVVCPICTSGISITASYRGDRVNVNMGGYTRHVAKCRSHSQDDERMQLTRGNIKNGVILQQL